MMRIDSGSQIAHNRTPITQGKSNISDIINSVTKKDLLSTEFTKKEKQ